MSILSLEEIGVELAKLADALDDHFFTDRETRNRAQVHLAEIRKDVAETAVAEKATRPAAKVPSLATAGK